MLSNLGIKLETSYSKPGALLAKPSSLSSAPISHCKGIESETLDSKPMGYPLNHRSRAYLKVHTRVIFSGSTCDIPTLDAFTSRKNKKKNLWEIADEESDTTAKFRSIIMQSPSLNEMEKSVLEKEYEKYRYEFSVPVVFFFI